MKNFIKKVNIAVALLSVTSIGYGYGDYNNSSACYPTANNYCCETPCCESDCCGKIFVGAEVLYWRAFESGLDDCYPTEVSDFIAADGRVVSTFSGKSRDQHFRWNPGYRIGAGYQSACNTWDIGAVYTHFHTHNKSPRNNDCGIHWNLDLDIIDLLAGYNVDLGSCFTLRPYIGLRAARIDQKLHSGTLPQSAADALVDNVFTNGSDSRQKFQGIGPLFGLEGDYNIGCGFSLYANASVSWLYGNYNLRLIEVDESIDSLSFCVVRKHLDANLAGADAGLGIRWHTCFCGDNRMIVQFGLEHHRYFDYNRIGGCGDLSFDGVNLSVGYEF